MTMPSTRLLSLIAELALTGVTEPNTARAETTTPAPQAGCSGTIQHPLDVKVEALDAVRRGQVVRVRLTTRSASALERAEVRLVHAGAAAIISPARVSLGTLHADTPAVAEFQVQMPRASRRTLLHFVVLADEDGFRLGRGAALNLLFDENVLIQKVFKVGR
jgi:hypothetical protein